MKRILALALIVTLLLSAAACTKQPTNESEQPVTTPTITLQGALDQMPEATHYDWADDLPLMDGSTSTIPLEAGIRAALFGTSIAEAELQVKHSTTYGSFYNLINDRCDLIFSVPLSETQIAEAADKGMELEMTKVAAEGFVFVLNANNPVDTLTQQQLKDIYSGKITNWKEVGGNDAPIIAYQRNETSGSQNFMHTFMGDTPLMEKLTDFVPSSMGALMDAVAYYDNAENAIGYSVYAYAADMYGNGNEIKFVHVDGVEPTKTTMADGSYPLLSFNYAVYDKATPADANLRKLVQWIGTDEGQRAVKAAGYIPLRNVGDIPETVVQLYTAVGTGPEKPADFAPSLVQCVANRKDSYGGLTYSEEVDGREEDVGIDGLANEELEKEINTFILDTKTEFLKQPTADRVDIDSQCINGYLALEVTSRTENYTWLETKTAIYDLAAGKQIPFSDLFFKGEDYVKAINAALYREFQRETKEQYLKREFVGLEAGHDTFTLRGVVCDAQNVYTSEYINVTVPELYTKSVLSVPRDVADLFDDTVELKWYSAEEVAHVTNQPLLWEHLNGELLDEEYYDTAIAQKINKRLCDIYQNDLTKDYFSAYYGDTFKTAEGFEMRLYALGDRWIVCKGGLFYPFAEEKTLPWDYAAYYLFDMTTGEEVPYTTLLKDGWDNAAWYEANETWCLETHMYGKEAEGVTRVEKPDLSGWRFCEFEFDGDVVYVTFERTTPHLARLWAAVPVGYFG